MVCTTAVLFTLYTHSMHVICNIYNISDGVVLVGTDTNQSFVSQIQHANAHDLNLFKIILAILSKFAEKDQS